MLSTKHSMKFQNIHRTTKSKLYMRASSAPIKPANADLKPSEKEKSSITLEEVQGLVPFQRVSCEVKVVNAEELM